jgi:hypothetical protein
MDLSVSQVFSSAFAMVGQRIGPLLGLWATFFAIMIVALLVFGGMMMGSVMAMAGGGMEDGAGAMGAGMILGVMVFYVGILLISFAQSAALNHMASPLVQPSFGDSLSAGARSSVTLLGVTVLLAIAYLVAAIPIGLLFAAIGAASEGLASILLILLLPALVYVGCRFVPLTNVVAVDRVSNPITAITRTWALTRGKVLPIFLVLLVFMIGLVVVYGILAWPLISASMAVASTGAPPDFAAIGMLSILGIFVAGIVVSLLGAAVISAIHAGLAGQGGTETAETFA